jgi:hypothetical protein
MGLTGLRKDKCAVSVGRAALLILTVIGTARYQLLYINRTTAEDIFNLLQDHKQGREMQNVTLLTGDRTSGWDESSIMSCKRARVACTVEDSKAACKAEGVLYYKGL